MEYGYTHGVGGTPNKVKSSTDPSLIGSGILSMGYGGYFPLWKKGNHFTPWGRGLGTHPTICLKYFHNSSGTFLFQLNPAYTRRYFQYVTLYRAITQN